MQQKDDKNTDVSGFVKNGGAVLANDKTARDAYKRQKQIISNINLNTQNISIIMSMLSSIIERIDRLEKITNH